MSALRTLPTLRSRHSLGVRLPYYVGADRAQKGDGTVTSTGFRPMGSVHGGDRGRHRGRRSGPWSSYILAALIAAVALVAVLVATLVVGRAAVHPGITPSVKAPLWKPNAGYYCAGLGELSSPLGQTALYISTMANASPTAASRSALLAYYHDFTHDLTPSTEADVARIVASYACPPRK